MTAPLKNAYVSTHIGYLDFLFLLPSSFSPPCHFVSLSIFNSFRIINLQGTAMPEYLRKEILMKYDKKLMTSKELSAVQKTLDSYKKFTQPFDKYSKFYAKAFAAQSIARKMQYVAVLNSKAVPVGLKKSMLTPSIKLSACIIDTYLNSLLSVVCRKVYRNFKIHIFFCSTTSYRINNCFSKTILFCRLSNNLYY